MGKSEAGGTFKGENRATDIHTTGDYTDGIF